MVTIKRDDGQTFTVKASTFCPADLTYFLQNASRFKPAATVSSESRPKNDKEPGTVECKDFVLSGTGFTLEKLDNDVVAYSNRGYTWQKVPSAVRGMRYTKVAGGGKPKIKVTAKRDCVLQAFTDITEGGSFMDGWEITSLRFTNNNRPNQLNIGVITRPIKAGQELEIGQGNWVGTCILFPKE